MNYITSIISNGENITFASLLLLILFWVNSFIKRNDRKSEEREKRQIQYAEQREARILKRTEEKEERLMKRIENLETISIEREDKYQEIVRNLSAQVVLKMDGVIQKINGIERDVKELKTLKNDSKIIKGSA
ncbi:hypothetical protein N2W52_001905 [Clostridium perfringens]|nr:hypothetical protein [Clostridium perfringens]MDK0982917.1 hypothetical protein [Clostridium perfringens]